MKLYWRILAYSIAVVVVVSTMSMVTTASVTSAVSLDAPVRIDVYPNGVNVTWAFAAKSDMVILLPSSFTSRNIRYQEKDGAVVNTIATVSEKAGQWTPPGLSDLMKALDRANQELEKLKSQLIAVDQTIHYLKSAIPSELSADTLSTIALAETMRIENEQKKQVLTQHIRLVQQQIESLRGNLEDRYGGNPDQLLRLDLTTNGVGHVEVTAYSPHASWQPRYKAVLDSSTETIRLDSFLAVQQRTGLSWDGMIHCHTASPMEQLSIPAIKPLVARITDPKESKALLDQPMASRSMLLAVEAVMPDMIQIESTSSISFSGKGAVPTSNQETILLTATNSYPVEMHATVIPYLQERAWITVETLKPVPALLKGKVELLADGVLSGSDTVTHLGGEPLELTFGRSPLITATSDPIVYTERQTWLGRRILRDGYTITVHNETASQASIVLIDRVPITGHDRISINLSIDPKPTEEADGILTWLITLSPGETKTVAVEYEINYPDKMDLVMK